LSLLFYNIFLVLYRLGITLVSPWNNKARLWIKGREAIFQKMEQALAGEKRSIVWMHCASLGEFEQGRPLIETVRKEKPETAILLTFFSSSGLEVTKSYKGADYIFYLPMDSRANARRLLAIVKPRLVLWVKYEYWYYYLTTINAYKIPVLLISGIFRPEQGFFKWYSALYLKMLASFSYLFVQDESSAELLDSIGYSGKYDVTGDTRFDRVVEIAEGFQPIDHVDEFCSSYPVIVAGSTWQEDDEELDHYANTHPEVRFIIAPHEINPGNLQDVKKMYHNSVFYSGLKKKHEVKAQQHAQDKAPNVLIIDNIGMLSRLYNYGTINFIGGGFGDGGVHNVLEAAVYGKPVIFGPVYDKYVEAVELLEEGGGFSVATALELEDLLNSLLNNKEVYSTAASAAKAYVYAKTGATGKIMQYIESRQLLG
jgi:3-deoxy-D-manno-octulosonic-acid transferase